MKQLYPAILEKDRDSDYGIFFPDFPGCISAAPTLEEVMQSGMEAVNGHVAMMAQDGDAIPPATPLDHLAMDADLNVVCVVMVPVTIPGRSKRINITLDENLIEEIDAISSNRSGFLAEAAREKMARLG